MKVMYRVGNTTIEVEGKDSKDCFTQLSAAVEVFRHTQCGACGSDEVFPQVRERDGNHYHELRCANCRAELAFGQKRVDGSLYPRRKDKNGNWLDNNGWTRWQASNKNEESPF